MTRSLLALGLALSVGLMLVVTPAPTAAQPAAQPKGAAVDAELVDKVKKSLDNGVRYLKNTQTKEGHWEGVVLKTLAGMDGGTTALATLALLNSGLKPGDANVDKALKYLDNLEPDKTYVRALQTMVFAETRDKKYLPKIAKNVDWFRDNAIGLKKGKLEGWSYPGNTIADNSNTQYALLGLYAAKTAGVKIEDDLWKAVQDYYTRTQLPDTRSPKAGYWTYHNFGDKNASFTMTVGGACGLWIAGMGLDKSEQQLDEKTGIAAKCGEYSENSALARGMYWIASNFNFSEGKSYFYNYYGIERLGRLSGQRFIGKMDWYREGCVRLVAMQEADGSFIDRSGRGIDSGHPVITTSFALLFLSKGRTPVLVSKFAWGNYRKAEDGKAAQ